MRTAGSIGRWVVLGVVLLAGASCATLSSPADFQSHIGDTVTVEGTASATALGGPTVALEEGGFVMASRPPQLESYIGRRVRVTGKLVLVPDPLVVNSPRGNPNAKQYMIDNARWELVGEQEKRRVVSPTGWGE